MTSGTLDEDPMDRQFREESPRWKGGSHAGREREAKTAKADRARFLHLWAVAPPNGLVMNKRGTDQTGEDDQASVVGYSALADALPSDAGSITGKKLASPMDHMTDKKTRA